jgi:hypothetical protein
MYLPAVVFVIIMPCSEFKKNAPGVTGALKMLFFFGNCFLWLTGCFQ